MNLSILYRPKLFSDVVGQKNIVDNFLSLCKSKRDPASFYLFYGQKGTGKTSIARILARTFNCNNKKNGEACLSCHSCKLSLVGKHPDILEFDIGKSRKVEDIDYIKELLIYKPHGKFRIIILDESHNMSNTAAESLLVTLEEPHRCNIFFFCTTELHKFKDTIIDRAINYKFNDIETKDIQQYIKYICESENIILPEDSLYILAASGNGSVRNSINNLEKIINSGKYDVDSVKKLITFKSKSSIEKLAKCIVSKKGMKAAEEIAYSMTQDGMTGYDIAEALLENTIEYCYKNKVPNIVDYLNIRQIIMLELNYLKNTGSKWLPIKHFVYSLFNRPVYYNKIENKKLELSEKQKKAIDVYIKLLQANYSIESELIKIIIASSGKKIFITDIPENLEMGDWYITLSDLEKILEVELNNKQELLNYLNKNKIMKRK